MTATRRCFLSTLAFAVALSGCTPLKESQAEKVDALRSAVRTRAFPMTIAPGGRVDTVLIDDVGKSITVMMNQAFAQAPFRPESVRRAYALVDSVLGEPFDGYAVRIKALNEPLEELVPNYYRVDSSALDTKRLPARQDARPDPIVRNASSPVRPSRGLAGNNIGLWHSHGYYYNSREDRWQWQRARLFESVEDLGPMMFTLPYLVPMLENAGARTFLPRERDTQRHEVIVDNDSAATGHSETGAWETARAQGFAIGNPPYSGNHNPFLAGTHRLTRSDANPSASATWLPDIPETGYYAVHVSHGADSGNVSDARYTVYHAGGATEFLVNQRIGGGTWVYLGTFKFRSGANPDSGRVVLTNESVQAGRTISADAVRFGGGVGVIARNGLTSGRPKYIEGARYYLQFAGVHDTLVYNLNADQHDYRDDYQSRGEYINYLRGAPFGPNRDPRFPGLGIPMDLSLAFHTDAGITTNDTTVGTLSIYSIEARDSARVFPDSMSRLANRDFADLVQTQIVDDLRALYDPAWSRRGLWNADYSESVRPNVPSVLLELLSHQNLLDVRFMLDPRFQFDVSRSIYKAMLRFLATQERRPYVVQPLPVTHMSAEMLGGSVRLSWRPQADPREPGAMPDRYLVYTRTEDGGFDNGRVVADTAAVIGPLEHGRIYSFKVTALNDGGESFPSEILSVCELPDARERAMIVNGFTRVCGPAIVESDRFSGVMSRFDAGVPDRVALNVTGEQYDFDPASRFRTDDAPGHGASHANLEGKMIPGNSFDFPYVHGLALRAAGMSFVSTSKAAVMDGRVDLRPYAMVDLILGEERETGWPRASMDLSRGRRFKSFPRPLQDALRAYAESGGNIFASGAYIGTDLRDSVDFKFARDVLHLRLSTGHASRSGRVVGTRSGVLPDSMELNFAADPTETIYGVEGPDGISPADTGATVLRYDDSMTGAALAWKGSSRVFVMGFPFETLISEEGREALMHEILGFFRR
jgi:hypothetical protein